MPISQPISIPRSESKQTFDALPEDVYGVEIQDIEYRTSKFTDEKTGEPKMELNVTFQVQDDPYKGRKLWRSMAPYLASGANGKKASILYGLCSASYGRDLTEQECEGFWTDAATFINGLIGKQLRVTVVQKKSGDKIYSNVAGFLKSKMVAPVTAPKEEEIKVEDIPF